MVVPPTDLLTQQIKDHAMLLGADLCGIADADRFIEAPPGHHPTDMLPDCRSVIVVASRFPTDQLDVVGDAYTVARDNMREKMNQIAVRLSAWINSLGLKSQEVLAAGRITREADGRIRDQLSLKHAGMLAGLGKIGRNSLLINEQYGNMIWISAVLTTTSLASDPLADYAACLPKCRRCAEACEVSAFEDQNVQQQVCYSHAFRKTSGRKDGKTEIIVCNTCRVVCPHAFGLGSHDSSRAVKMLSADKRKPKCASD